MQEGGLQDEGGTVDKESGNDVPSGSLKKEVRDDVPAMLSEGEFVIPADVVRYIGLEKLMQMRQEAKMGLQMMEKMGQMGNSEEAEIPDDLPFGVTDIVVMGSDDDEKEMAQGGVIYAQEGTDVPQQTDFEQMMGYEAGRGDNPYAPSRVAYKNKKGEVVYVLEDYLGRPMESTTGLTRVTPYGPEGDQPTPAPSPDPIPDDGQSNLEARREEKRKERRQAEKAELRKQQAEDAMQTSAERVFPNLTPEEARSKYGELTLSQRIKLVPQEIKVMTGSDVSSEVVEDIINNPNKTKGKGGVVELVGNFITDLVSGIFKPFGIDINKTPDIQKVIEKEGDATGEGDITDDKIKITTEEEPSFIQGMKDADRVAGTPSVTPSFVQGMKDADRVAGTPVVTGADNNPNLPTSPEDKERIAAKNRESSLEQYGSRYGALGDSDESMSTFKPTVEIPQGEGGVDLRGQLVKTPTNMFAQGDPAQSYTPPSTNEQTSNMLSAAQANTSPISTDDPTFTSSVIPSKVEPVSIPSFVQGMTDADKVAGTTPERKGQIFDSVPTMFDLSGYRERQAQRQASFNAQVDQINEGLKILEGTTLSSGDRKKTSTRKLKIDAKQGTGAFADRQRKEKDRDKRRKRQDAKKAADKRVKDYKEGKQTFRGRGGRAQGGLMKKDYP